MKRIAKHEKKLPDALLEKIRNQVESINELVTIFYLELGEKSSYAKRLTYLKNEFESIYSELMITQSKLSEKEDLKVNKISSVHPAKISHKKIENRLSTVQVDNINFYIRYLNNEEEVYLLYEFFDLIVSKVKEYGCYNADQIWNGISNEVETKLSNKSSAIKNMRDILNNDELKAGLQFYADSQLDKQ